MFKLLASKTGSRIAAFLQWLFPAQHKPGKSLIIVYGVAAAAVALLEYVLSSISGQLPPTSCVIALAVLVVLLVLCGTAIPYTEFLFVLVFLALSVFGLLEPLSTPIFGVYVLVVVWIVRSWMVPAFLVCFAAETALIVASQKPGLQLIGAVMGTSVAILTGLLIRYYDRKARVSHSQAEHFKKESEEASRTIKNQLAAQLHDALAKDLAHIVMMTQQLVKRGSASVADLRALGQLATVASGRIRTTILGLETEAERTNISQTIGLVTKMLSTRSISLEAQVETDIDAVISRQQALLVGMTIREGCTNILKYAPQGSSASLSLDAGDDGLVTVSLGNTISQEAPVNGVTSGFGLANLDQQLTVNNGSLTYGRRGERWILFAEIPDGRKERPHEQ
ncbi:MAG: ATP-binding protein [Varibaculum sp.]|nr:ATP-binding protein [Varibaculum sp.]